MPASPVQFVGRRLGAAVLAAAAFAALAPAAAPAQALRWRNCSNVDGFECATLRVPLDRSGAVKGTIGLHVARERRTVKGGRRPACQPARACARASLRCNSCCRSRRHCSMPM